ncbi:SCO family protein [Paenibacillus sp. NPDC057967]|uniref:SCO family protein n=1 Tax=Paenibacillus sp. NPDC057967 TaxID=3346293 RepID=UPI0036D8FB5A
MKRIVLTGILILAMLAAAGCGNGKPNQLNYTVEPFAFTNQDEKEISLADLKGSVWVANLIFTYCETVCPVMSVNMAELQQRLKSANVDAQLVSFSVDPEHDDPSALRSYLGKFNADFSNWSALTGYEFDAIKTFVLRSFKAPIAKDEASGQVIHGTSFYLVDQSGTVVAKYDGLENTPYEKIIKDIKALQR